MFPNGEVGYNLAKKNNALNARDLRPCFESLPQPVIGRIHGRLLPWEVRSCETVRRATAAPEQKSGNCWCLRSAYGCLQHIGQVMLTHCWHSGVARCYCKSLWRSENVQGQTVQTFCFISALLETTCDPQMLGPTCFDTPSWGMGSMTRT